MQVVSANIGVAIIIFTIVIYLLLLPLTYKQQKFSKLSSKMNPELKAIQEKYKNKRDQESMTRQNQEMQELYKKYGVSPTGSCVQLLIQMPILFALYRVIYNIPAYVDKVFQCLDPLAQNIISTVKGLETIIGLEVTTRNFPKYVENGNFEGDTTIRSIVDVLNRASSAEWDTIGSIPGLDTNIFNTAREQFEHFNNFLGLNIANSPWYTIKESFNSGHYIMIIGALMIPIFAALTQWLNTLFMPHPSSNGNDTMSSTMKSMNIMMPLMSAVFCFSLPSGLGLYWIAGAVIRCIQQIIINKHIDKMNLDEIIEKNAEKYRNKKREEPASRVNSAASLSTRALGSNTSISKDNEEALNKAREAYNNNTNPNSIAARANLVRDYNEKNKK